MFNKSKYFFKRLVSCSSSLKTLHPPFKYQQFFPFQSNHPIKPFRSLINSSLTSPSFINWNRNKYKEDIDLLKDLSQKELTYIHQLFNRFSSSNNLQSFSSKEIRFIISTLQRLSVTIQEQGNINKADSYLTEAEEICQKLNIKNTIEVANGHFMRADNCLNNDRDLDKVEEHLDEAERICWLFDDLKEAQLLKIYIEYDRAFFETKRNENDKALELFNEILKKTNVMVSPEILLGTYREMTLIYSSKKNSEKTEECLLNGLKIAADHFGEYSKQAFEISSSLFAFYLLTRNNQEAFYYAKKTLEIALKVLPKESVEVASCYSNLGNLYLMNGKIDKALESIGEAIEIFEKLPQKYSNILSDLYCLASNLSHLQGKTQEASALLIKSNKTLALANLENDPKIIETYLQRAGELKCLKRWDEAEDYIRNALKVCQDSDPSNKLRIVDLHFSLGEFFYEKQDWETALQVFQETEKLFQECSAESFAQYLLYSYLGGLYLITKDYDRSLNYLQKAVESCELVGNIGFLLFVYSFIAKVFSHKGMEKEGEEAEKKCQKCIQGLNQSHPNTQASFAQAFKVFKTLHTLDETNQL